MSNSKKERFFWQYNVQAKGPKGQRLVIKKQLEDPHVLNEITDPVFSPHCSVRGIKVKTIYFFKTKIVNHFGFHYSTVERLEKEMEMI